MLQQYITVCTLLSDYQKYNRWTLSKVWTQGGGACGDRGVDAKLLTTPRDLDTTSHKSSPKVVAATGMSSLCYFKQPSVKSENKNSLFQTWCLSWFLSTQVQPFELPEKYAYRGKIILTIENPTKHCKEKAWARPETWRKQIITFLYFIK